MPNQGWQLQFNYKRSRIQNENYKEEVRKIYSPNFNYITIWKQKICKEIADVAQLHYDYYLNREKAVYLKIRESYAAQTRRFIVDVKRDKRTVKRINRIQ